MAHAILLLGSAALDQRRSILKQDLETQSQ